MFFASSGFPICHPIREAHKRPIAFKKYIVSIIQTLKNTSLLLDNICSRQRIRSVASRLLPAYPYRLYTFLFTTEMNIQFMKRCKESSERSALGHLSEGIHILWEALATITEATIRSRNVSMRVIDVA